MKTTPNTSLPNYPHKPTLAKQRDYEWSNKPLTTLDFSCVHKDRRVNKHGVSNIVASLISSSQRV
jgi:hypothetical protein